MTNPDKDQEEFFAGMEPKNHGTLNGLKDVGGGRAYPNPLFGQHFKNKMMVAISEKATDPEKVYNEIEHETVVYIANIIKDLGARFFRTIRDRTR